MRAGALQAELDGPPHVPQDGRFPLVRVWQHLAVEGEIAGLLDVGRDRVKQPHAIVGTVFFFERPVLGSGPMSERLHDGNRAAR